MYKLLLCILTLQWAEFVFYYFKCLLLGIGLIQTLPNSFHLFVMATKCSLCHLILKIVRVSLFYIFIENGVDTCKGIHRMKNEDKI